MRRLRLKRLLCGISQAELARRVKKSPAWLSLVERGYLKPDAEMLFKLKAALSHDGGNHGDRT